MKTKKFNGKLKLNKVSIERLDSNQSGMIKGGDIYVIKTIFCTIIPTCMQPINTIVGCFATKITCKCP